MTNGKKSMQHNINNQDKRITKVTTQGAVQEEQIRAILETQGEQAALLREIHAEVRNLALAVTSGRPTWSISIIITFMSATLIGVVVYLITM